MTPVPTPEVELLLLCARLHIDEARARRIATLVAGDLDWDALLPKARRHGLIPLMHRAFSTLPDNAMPAAPREKIQSLAHTYRFHNLMLVSELLGALRALQAAGLTVLPYKGPALAAFLYGDLALRHITDIDLLVQPREAIRARRVLLDLGYLPVPARSEQLAAMLVPFHYEFAFTSRMETIVELTWRMSAAYWRMPQLPAAAWGRLTRYSFAELEVPWLTTEDLLIVLCLHGCKHKWDTLKWIVDIAELLRTHPGLDWAQVMHDARSQGAERMILLGVSLAHELLDAPLPLEVLEATSSTPTVAALAQEVRAELYAGRNRQADTLESLRFVSRLTPRLDTKIACRVLPLAYLARHRLVLPVLGALRRAARGG